MSISFSGCGGLIGFLIIKKVWLKKQIKTGSKLAPYLNFP